jgi:hypothetical protein
MNMLNNVIKKLVPVLKSLLVYCIILLLSVSAFLIGGYYQKINASPKTREISNVFKQDIVIAVDENNNLIIIEKSTGDYTVYQDSIGKSIFNVYANKVLSRGNSEK